MVTAKTQTQTVKTQTQAQTQTQPQPRLKSPTLNLLKYDLRWLYKTLVPLYLAALACAIFGRLLSLITDSFLISLIGGILLGASIGLIVNIYINTIARCWVRFARNLYKDESYLTHTLPLPSKTLFRAKVLAALIVNLTILAVMLLGLFFSLVWLFPEDRLGALASALQIAADSINFPMPVFAGILVLAFFVQTAMTVLCGYIGIVLGHRFNQHRALASTLIGLGVYGLSQFLAIAVLLLACLVVPIPGLISLILRGSQPPLAVTCSAVLLITGIYIIYTIILYFIGQKVLKKGVNID